MSLRHMSSSVGRLAVVVVASAWLAVAVPVAAQPSAQPPSAGQGEFVPIKELPQAEQVPAGQLVLAAYGFVWLALMVYLWSVWQRVGKVQRDLEALDRRLSDGQRRN
jgi:hypothetical protein